MRKFIFIWMMGIFFPSLALLAQYNPNYCLDYRVIAAREASHQMHLQQQESLKESNQLISFDIHYLKCNWTVNPSVSAISGIVKTSFTILSPVCNSISLSLSTALTVNSVIMNGQALSFSHTPGDVLTIQFLGSLHLGDTASVEINYQGTPPNSGFGSFIREEHNGVPIIWTLSEPYGSQDWWPSKLDLNDKVDSIDIYVTTPSGYRAASNGLLVEEIPAGSDISYHWKHRYPITAYLVAIAVTNYQQYSHYVNLQNGTSLEVLNYVYPENLSSVQAATAEIVQMIEYFDTLVGLYPFYEEKYGHAQFSWSGGMEHQTMSFMGLFSVDLQAHELAHQWFGDKITCASWEDIWLNEGFATYFTALYRLSKGETTFWNNWKASQSAFICSISDGSVYCDDVSSVSRIFSGRLSYAKGGYLLHMIRWMMGDEAFYQAIRNYISDQNLVFKYASTNDLVVHLEAEAGFSFTEFMQDWFYGEGFPSYQISWNSFGNTFQIILDQTTSDASVDFFEMKVPIRVFGPQQDTTVIFNHEFSGQEFTLDLPFQADSIQFDPERWILSAGNSINPSAAVEDLSDKVEVRIFPNPVGSELIIHTSESWEDLIVTDVTGRMREQRKIRGGKSLILDVSYYPSGTYIIKFKRDNQIITRKFIKFD